MRININIHPLKNEGCRISNVETGGFVNCLLVKKHDKFVEYVHEFPLEGRKTALVRRCSREFWDNYSYITITPFKKPLTGIEKRFQEDMINDMDSQY